MNASRWIQYFENHRHHHDAECYDWAAAEPDPSRPDIVALAASLAIFQLGESGGGSRLRRYADFLTATDPAFAGYGRAVAMFVDEENGHAALLRQMVLRLGGTLLVKQWSNSIFRFIRNSLGLEFNVQVLLSAELIARGYYGLLARHAPDPVIRACCGRITRDEVGHIAFHVDFFRDRLGAWPAWRSLLWRAQFQFLFVLAGWVVWLDHGKALQACGITRELFTEKTARACRSFLGGLATRSRAEKLGQPSGGSITRCISSAYVLRAGSFRPCGHQARSGGLLEASPPGKESKAAGVCDRRSLEGIGAASGTAHGTQL